MEMLRRWIWDIAQCLIISIVISYLLTSFVIEARQIPTGSMIPTIAIGDKVIVDKLFYRIGEIERGDIVVFSPPPAAQAKVDYIKRVIGLPGDIIEVKGHKVFINGKPITENYVAEYPDYDYGPLKIPEASLFVMGDNRNKSVDSHSWGVLPLQNVKGKALIKFWPLDRIGTFN